MQTILITGGSGMVGKHLTTLLVDKGYQVIIMGRSLPNSATSKNTQYALWNVENQTIDEILKGRRAHFQLFGYVFDPL